MPENTSSGTIPANEPRLVDESNDISMWNAAPAIHFADLRSLTGLAEAAATSATTEKAPAHLYGTDSSALPPLGDTFEKAGFQQWPDVVSTLYNKMYTLVGFDPSNTDFSSPVYTALKTKFSTAPFWNGLVFDIDHREATLRIRDFRQAVNAVIDLLAVLPRGSVDEIIGRIRQAATLAARATRESVNDKIFHLNNVNVVNGKLYCSFLYGDVTMKRTTGKYEAVDQTIKVVRAYGVLNFDFCKRHADRIVEYDLELVDSWEGKAAGNQEQENDSSGW